MNCIQHVDIGGKGEGPEGYEAGKLICGVPGYTCSECRREIKTGEKYLYECGIWEGIVQSYRTCEDCCSIRRSFFCAGFYYEFLIEHLKEHISATRGEIGEIHISCLTPAAREMVCDLIEEQWARNEE